MISLSVKHLTPSKDPRMVGGAEEHKWRVGREGGLGPLRTRRDGTFPMETPTPNIAFSQQQGCGRATVIPGTLSACSPPLLECLDTTSVRMASPEASGTVLLTDVQTPKPGRSPPQTPAGRGNAGIGPGEKW